MYSQTLRFLHVCSENAHDTQFANQKIAFTQQGHSKKETDHIFKEATQIFSTNLLQYKKENPHQPYIPGCHISSHTGTCMDQQTIASYTCILHLGNNIPNPLAPGFQATLYFTQLIITCKFSVDHQMSCRTRPWPNSKYKTCQHISTVTIINRPHNETIRVFASYTCLWQCDIPLPMYQVASWKLHGCN